MVVTYRAQHHVVVWTDDKPAATEHLRQGAHAFYDKTERGPERVDSILDGHQEPLAARKCASKAPCLQMRMTQLGIG